MGGGPELLVVDVASPEGFQPVYKFKSVGWAEQEVIIGCVGAFINDMLCAGVHRLEILLQEGRYKRLGRTVLAPRTNIKL